LSGDGRFSLGLRPEAESTVGHNGLLIDRIKYLPLAQLCIGTDAEAAGPYSAKWKCHRRVVFIVVNRLVATPIDRVWFRLAPLGATRCC